MEINASSQSSLSQAPILVFGDGSASVFLISQLLKKQESVIWVKDAGSQIWPVMPHVKSELALGALLDCYQFVSNDVFANPIEKGTAHRVFRNKGFKMPAWKKSSHADAQQKAFEELVWEPEQSYLGVNEFRITGLSTMKIEEELRSAFDSHPLLKKIELAPVVEFEVFEHGGKVQFSNGFITEFKQLYYSGSLSEIKMIPKLASVLKHQIGKARSNSAVSALQVVFQHDEPLLQTIENGLVIPMNRDAGESFDRDVLGFFPDPNRSVWTVFLQADEIEENHEIMKKLRKLKQSLNKAFDEQGFIPSGKKDFMSTVIKEQVRFEPGFIVFEGNFNESTNNSDFVLLNDSLGITYALEQIAKRFDIAPMSFDLEYSENEEILNQIHSVANAPSLDAQF
jgi:hypothetical protein